MFLEISSSFLCVSGAIEMIYLWVGDVYMFPAYLEELLDIELCVPLGCEPRLPSGQFRLQSPVFARERFLATFKDTGTIKVTDKWSVPIHTFHNCVIEGQDIEGAFISFGFQGYEGELLEKNT